jgi:hypothetical protein
MNATRPSIENEELICASSRALTTRNLAASLDPQINKSWRQPDSQVLTVRRLLLHDIAEWR